MRLITHNMVQCHVKDCNTNNFPLRFEDAEVELIEAEYNPTFLINMLPKLDWEALINTAVQLGINNVPTTIPEDAAENEVFLKGVHNLILETHVQQGKMVCNNCQHVYNIKDGIPNMLMAEHEI